MERVAVRAVAAVGSKVTEIVQVAPAGTLLVQPAAVKSAPLAPDSCKELMDNGALPLLVTVTA